MAAIAFPFHPHPAQWEIFNSRARFRDVSCGRRFGKTALLSTECLAELAHPDGNRRVWLVTPVFKQGAESWDMNFYSMVPMLRNMEDVAGQRIVAEINKSDRLIRLLNGSVYEHRTGERDENLRGGGLDLLAIDEAGQLRESAWKALRPTVSDRLGRVLRAGTPRGRNWWYREWKQGQEHVGDRASWCFPSSANPYFPAEEWEIARAGLPVDWFRQEYEAEFLESQAAVFNGLDRCFVGGGATEPSASARYVHGLDYAKEVDWTVLITLDTVTGRVVAITRLQRIKYIQQAEIIAAVIRRYPGEVWADKTGVGVAAIEPLELHGVKVHGYTFTNESKKKLVGGLIVAVESASIVIPTDKPFDVIKSEMLDFEYRVTPTGNVSYGAPEGLHDDAVIALALAVYGRNRGGTFTREARYGMD